MGRLVHRQIARIRQPGGPVGINWANPITRDLAFIKFPKFTLDAGPVPPTGAFAPGSCYSFNPAVTQYIDTKVNNPAVSSHSAVLFVQHPSMAAARMPAYLSSRVSANAGFSFYQASAAGNLPTETFTLGYVHGSIAAYNSTVQIANANVAFVCVGMSATVGSSVSFFANGQQIDSMAIGAINQTTDDIVIGREIYFNGAPGDYNTPFAAYWKRSLSPREHASVRANPWQLIAPLYARRFVMAGGLLLPTLSSVTYTPGTLTSTGYGVRVTAA